MYLKHIDKAKYLVVNFDSRNECKIVFGNGVPSFC